MTDVFALISQIQAARDEGDKTAAEALVEVRAAVEARIAELNQTTVDKQFERILEADIASDYIFDELDLIIPNFATYLEQAIDNYLEKYGDKE